ncbi:MAG: hypothetical protein Q8Q29_06325 [Actinomycetota bacterium]|jgi:hypothetical protein|nr:hypothetical protein [Actinomycetota bacterium]
MGAVAIGALLVAVLLAIVALMLWQSARRSPLDDPAEYVVGEATGYVYERLSDRALGGIDPDDVRLILEWQLHYHQVVAPRESGTRPVLGSGDSIEYITQRAAEEGRSFDYLDIAEVIAADTEYLVSIGAVGEPVEES